MRSIAFMLGISWLATLAVAGCSGKKQRISDAPPAPPPSPPRLPASASESPVPIAPASSEEEWFRTATLEELQAMITDAYFDYDRNELRMDARRTIEQNFEWLRKPYNSVVLEIEGHCDERGTPNYNLALGDRRATSVAGYLVDLGFPRERLRTVTYGKERPQCIDSRESCWWRNRRAHFRILSKDGRGPDGPDGPDGKTGSHTSSGDDPFQTAVMFFPRWSPMRKTT
jgi:peptidoglycan-associated lipoprotein